MDHHRHSHRRDERRESWGWTSPRWLDRSLLTSGLAALVWLLLRTGTRPSRFAYPCQQAAATTAAAAFGAPLAAAVMAARGLAKRLARNPAGVVMFMAVVLATVGTVGHLPSANADTRLAVDPPADYRAEVFHVSDCPEDPVGDRFPGLDNLLELMGYHGLKLYRSDAMTRLSGPDGIIAAADVVLIKINYQWGARGGTNVDLLRGLIRAILDHPDGFTGEVVVCENSQFRSIADFDRTNNNAQDHGLSPRDVVLAFQAQGWRVGRSSWTEIRSYEVDEFSAGDDRDGYIVLPYDAQADGRVSYPKFTTEYGTMISLRDGIWSPGEEVYDREGLKFINVPVLKSHHATYGATACVKNYMGVVTDQLSTNSHNAIGRGILGALMAEIGPADLNLLDCIWVNAIPTGGPGTVYDVASRRNELVASTDPVAADVWAVTNILIPAFIDNGFSPPWPRPSATPDDPGSNFRVYLDASMARLLDAGYRVTNDIQSIDAFSWDGRTVIEPPRRPSGRVGG